MSSTITYVPGIHCVIDINEGRQVSATRRIEKDGRSYRTCDLHAEVVERCPSIGDALREVRRQRAITGGAA